MKVQFLFYLLAALSSMTPQEKQRTGISKLTSRELEALQQWINQNGETSKEEKPTSLMLQQNLQNGRMLRLSDGSTWEIHPADVAITQGWLTPVDLTISASGQLDYPTKLTNTLSGSSVRARVAADTQNTSPGNAARTPSYKK